MQESMRFCHVVHSMKRIEIPLSHIRDKNKFKSRDSLFHLVLCFKTIFVTLLFNVLRLLFVLFGSMFQDFPSLTHTHTQLFVFPFTIFTSTPLYTHVHSLSYHPISNTLRQKTMSVTFNLSITLT